MVKHGLDFDDILLIPVYSDITSRTEPSTKTTIAGIEYDHVIIPANMDSIATLGMRDAIKSTNGMFIHHRFTDPQFMISGEWATVGVKDCLKDPWLNKVDQLIDRGINICIDIAHAHNKLVLEAAEYIKKKSINTKLLIGNIATSEAARDLCMVGVDAVKAGIGGGNSCSTRMVCGVGMPAVECIQQCVDTCDNFKVDVIYDGGINRYDRACKAIALGCSGVMMGFEFAHTNEADLLHIDESYYYCGQSSKEVRTRWYKESIGIIEEGMAVLINNPKSESAENVIKRYTSALQTSMSYLGAKDLEEYWRKADFIVTNRIK